VKKLPIGLKANLQTAKRWSKLFKSFNIQFAFSPHLSRHHDFLFILVEAAKEPSFSPPALQAFGFAAAAPPAGLGNAGNQAGPGE
jgi:hypothetical protein